MPLDGAGPSARRLLVSTTSITIVICWDDHRSDALRTCFHRRRSSKQIGERIQAYLGKGTRVLNVRRDDEYLRVVVEVADRPSEREEVLCRVRALAESRRPWAALGALRRARSICPLSADLFAAIGCIYYGQGHYRNARKAYVLANEIRQQDPGMLRALGTIALREGQIGCAEHYLRRAVRACPEDAGTREALDAIVRYSARAAAKCSVRDEAGIRS